MHCDILTTVGCMTEDSRIVYREGFPAGKLLEGVYIDDHLLAWIASRKLLAKPIGPDYDRFVASRSAYSEALLDTSLDKGIGFASNEKEPIGVQSFTAWGTHIASEAGYASTPAEKRLNLFLLVCM